MKRLLIAFVITLMLATGANAASFWPATDLTGGGTGALDKIPANSLGQGDVAFVSLVNHATYGTIFFIYHLNATSGVAEALPTIVKPDTSDGSTEYDGDKRWILSSFGADASVLYGTGDSYIEMRNNATGRTPDSGEYSIYFHSDLKVAIDGSEKTVAITDNLTAGTD